MNKSIKAENDAVASANLVCTHDSACTLCGDVYKCTRCAGMNHGFQRPFNYPVPPLYYRFPPIIGCTSPDRPHKEILFVGINPRISKNNMALHNWLTAAFSNFLALARNQYMGGGRYICPGGPEPHYYPHMRVVNCIYGPTAQFEDHAAVTELFLCASNNAGKIYGRAWNGRSTCADAFLCRILKLIRPKAIVAVGSVVRRYFEMTNLTCIDVPVVPMVHPNARGYTGTQRDAEMRRTCIEVKRKLGMVSEGQPPIMPQPETPDVELALGSEVDLPDSLHLAMASRVDYHAHTALVRHWTINGSRTPPDHFGEIPEDIAYVDVCLGMPDPRWGKPRNDPNKSHIGTYRLDLPQLCQGGYVVNLGNGNYRVRFVVLDGIVYIQLNAQGPRLPIGTI